MDLELKGKTAIVTGASSGIGRAAAMRLAAEGAQVAIQGRDRDRLDAVAVEVVAAGGAEPVVIPAELLDDDAVARITDTARDRLGPIEILVNVAGGSRPLDLDAPESAWDEAMTLNFTRPRQLAAAVVPAMKQANWGRIITVTGKMEPLYINGAVCAKAAVHAWSKGASKLLGEHGITVNCVAPGKIMSAQILRNYTEEFRSKQAAEEIAVRRYGDPSDMANVIAFLSSPIAGYISGTVIPVDGGMRRTIL